MRLIDATTLQLCDFTYPSVPPYAILSHTWNNEELTFQDMSSSDSQGKLGFKKLQETCRLARELKHPLRYVWVDTCCIDKSSSAELTESINSMFKWYHDAEVCFAYLEDLQPEDTEMAGCRWFTRGFTLQELLAPQNVEFYDAAWKLRGNRRELKKAISAITAIDTDILIGTKSIGSCSIAERMCWASNRQTSRIEDIAYCLLGIFQVNMSLIYGEGMNAFRRLQEEICKRSNELTIFAWDNPETSAGIDGLSCENLFASSPAMFTNSSNVRRFDNDTPDFSVTNKGLHMSGDEVPIRVVQTDDGIRYLMMLGCRYSHKQRADGGILLRKIGPRYFVRDGRYHLAGFGKTKIEQSSFLEVSNYYIIIDTEGTGRIWQSFSAFRKYAIHIPEQSGFELKEVVPESLWDVEDRVFLRPNQYDWVTPSAVLAMPFKCTLQGHFISLLVLCDYRGDHPVCRVISRHGSSFMFRLLFHGTSREDSVHWVEFLRQNPHVLEMDNGTTFTIDGTNMRVSASCNRNSDGNLYHLIFDISQEEF